jgi:Tol biopolymer transport system component/DNA-binding winged helix-turn-helix (wHTH) protein
LQRPDAASRRFRLGEWLCEPLSYRVSGRGRTTQVEPKLMQVLECLAAHPGQVVTRRQLLDTVWADAVVTEQVLSRAISELRKVFDDDSRTPRVIETIAKSGYRLLLPVERLAAEAVAGHGAAASSLPSAAAGPGSASTRAARKHWVLLPVGIVLGVLLAIVLWRGDSSRGTPQTGRAAVASAMRLSVLLPADAPPELSWFRCFELTPDGRSLIYTANQAGRRQLYRLRFDQKEATPIHGTEGGYGPFVSRDGTQLGFYVAGDLKRVPLDGGQPVTLQNDASDPVGATWAADGTLVFARRLLEGLTWIPPGEKARKLTQLHETDAERSHLWPHFLPGDEHAVFTVWRGGSIRGCDLELLHVASGQRRALVDGGSDARYLSDGRLLFSRSGTLMQVPFDIERLEVLGRPTVIAEDLFTHPVTGAAHYAVAPNGTIVYVARDAFAAGRVLQRIDPNGKVEPLTRDRSFVSTPRLSPDGSRLAATVMGRGMQLWLIDLHRGALERVTQEGFNFMPAWTRDGRSLAFSSDRHGPFNLYAKPARSDEPARRLTESANMQYAGSWSRDGRLLAYAEFHPDSRWDVWLLPVREEGSARETPLAPVPFLVTPFDEFRPSFSPDGHALAYVSNESGRWGEGGRWEVYVRLIEDRDVRVQVSTDGGTDPRWSVDGTRLLYRQGGRLLEAEIETAPTLRVGETRLLHDGLELAQTIEVIPTYDVDRNGHILTIGLGRPLQPTALTVLLGTSP